MIVDVMRIGDDSTVCSCQYETKDLSAKAGQNYTAMSGRVEFQPGETMLHMSVYNCTLRKDLQQNRSL